MSVMSYALAGLRRKRLAGGLTGMIMTGALCTLLSACGDDGGPAAVSSNQRSTENPAADSEHSNTARTAPAVMTANPWAPEPASSPAPLATQSPAPSASDAEATLSAAASAPLAPPVIHTVD